MGTTYQKSAKIGHGELDLQAFFQIGEMKFKCLDILMICISFERVFDADQQSYNNHTLKINIFPDISIRSKKMMLFMTSCQE